MYVCMYDCVCVCVCVVHACLNQHFKIQILHIHNRIVIAP